MHEICQIVSSDEDFMRLDAFLFAREVYSSRSAAAKAIDAGDVLVDGVNRVKSYCVRAGESVFCTIQDKQSSVVSGECIPLDIRYEDNYLAVLSKQAGLVCHPTDTRIDGTLVNALVYKYGIGGLCDVQGNGDRPGIVHRLDADTSGLMLVAKDNVTGEALMQAISLKQVQRRYKALVHGIITVNNGLIDAPIMRNKSDRKTMSVGDGPSSREALTTFEVLQRYAGSDGNEGYTLVECKLHTGRTHQIRVHMQYIGHPVVGDLIYNSKGPKAASAQLGLKRQFLHSWHLTFNHPIDNAEMEFKDDLPSDLSSALSLISKRAI